MTPSVMRETAAALDEVVRQAPGVSTLYRSGPLIRTVVAAGASALGQTGEDDPRVVVDSQRGRLTVAVTIGVDADSAAGTCRVVRDAIAVWMSSHGHEGAAIAVTVAQVYWHNESA